MRSLFKKYGLAFVLAALFLAAWVGQAWAGWVAFQSEQAEHGQRAMVADEPIIQRLEELRAEIRALKRSAAGGAPRAAARHPDN